MGHTAERTVLWSGDIFSKMSFFSNVNKSVVNNDTDDLIYYVNGMVSCEHRFYCSYLSYYEKW